MISAFLLVAALKGTVLLLHRPMEHEPRLVPGGSSSELRATFMGLPLLHDMIDAQSFSRASPKTCPRFRMLRPFHVQRI